MPHEPPEALVDETAVRVDAIENREAGTGDIDVPILKDRSAHVHVMYPPAAGCRVPSKRHQDESPHPAERVPEHAERLRSARGPVGLSPNSDQQPRGVPHTSPTLIP